MNADAVSTRRFLGKQRILIVLLIIAASAAVYVFGIRKDMSDFGVCYKAGDRILSGETLYRPSDGHLQFKYAPAAAMAYAPFSLLPWEAAKAAWFLVMAGSLAGILWLLARWAARRRIRIRGPLIWSLLIVAKGLGRELQLGQVNLVILLLLVLLAGEDLAGRPGRAGFFWGLSLLFKPYGLIFLPYLIIKKKWTSLAAGAGTLLAALLIPAAVYGFTGNIAVLGEWFRTLSASTPGLLRVGDNASLFAFFAKTFSLSDSAAMAAGGIAASILGGLLLVMIFRGKKAGLEGAGFVESAALMMLIPLLSPLGWNYNYLYGLPAVFALLTVWPVFGKGERAVLAANFVLVGATLRETMGKSAFRFYTRQALLVPSLLFVFAMLFIARRHGVL